MAATDGGTDWESIARRQLERRAAEVAGEVEQAVRLLGVEIGRGGANRDHVVNARTSIEDTIYLVEDALAPVVPGADVGADPAKYIRDDGAAADYLKLRMAQVNELNNGATVELTASEVRDVANGETVCYETAAGQTVRVRQTSAGEVNRGP